MTRPVSHRVRSAFALAVGVGVVSLAGEPSLHAEGETRLFVDAFGVFVYSEPRIDPAPIGYLRGGQSVRVAPLEQGSSPRRTADCPGGFYPILPNGYVCRGREASLEPTRYSKSMATLAPAEGPYPYEYALSMGTPSYRRLPTEAEWLRRERKFGALAPRPLAPHHRGHEELLGGEPPSVASVPAFLELGGSVSRAEENRLVRREVPFGSMLAFTQTFEHLGRTFVQSADGTVVPLDRLRPYRHSTFEGAPLGDERRLPLGWARARTLRFSLEGPNCHLDPAEDSRTELPASCLVRRSEHVERRTLVELTGRRVEIAGTSFVEERGGALLAEDFLFVAEKRPRPLPQLDKWIHFSIGRGTLVAYRGEVPVFATLASPGIGGTPRAGGDPLTDRTTPLGTKRIQFKYVTDDMSPEVGEHRSYFIADVPYAMYFDPPFAIHVAYWHDSFGEPMSGGCINVSPRDGARLFAFTDPPVPAGWHGVGASREFGLGTTIHVTR